MTLSNSKATWRRYRHACGCAALIVLLGGCSTLENMGEATADGLSTVGSALNPVNWFGDDKKKSETATTESEKDPKSKPTAANGDAAGAAGSKGQAKPDKRYQALRSDDAVKYPSLGAVPERPKVPLSARRRAERASLHEGLVSDAANARYSDEELRARDLPIVGKSPAVMALSPDAARSNERIAEGPKSQVNGEALRVAGGDPSDLPPPAEARPAPPKPRDVNEARYAEPPAATQTVQVATIYFADGSARLSGQDREIVRQVADIVRDRRGRIQIIGHSSMGRPGKNESKRQRVNYHVSLKRAQAIAAALRRYGISPDDMVVSGEGSRQPIYAETAPSGAASNRRAEIYMEYQKRI